MLKLNKKILVILSILVSLNIYANDNDDMKFINKLYQNKEYKLTVEELNKFIVKYPSSRHYDNAQFLLGHSLYEMKEYEKAGKVFHKLINTNYNNEAYYYLALTSIYQNYLSDAYKYSRELKDLPREIVLFQLAMKEYSNNNLSKAREYFEELRRLRGEYRSIALFNLGLISYNTGAYLDSTIYLDEYLTLEKNDIEKMATSNYIMAFSYSKLNNKIKALEHYGRIEKLYVNSSYYNLALRDLLFYYTEEKENKMIEEYTKKLQGTQFAELAFTNTGNYYYNLAEYSKAVEYYEKISNNIDSIYYLGRSYLYLNKKNEALREFNKLSKSEKYKTEYFYYTSFVLFEQNKYKEVISLLDGIENRANKDMANLYQILGDSAYKLEDYPKAQKYYGLVFNEKKTKDEFYKYYLVSSLNGDRKKVEELFEYYKTNFSKDRVYNESVYLIIGNIYAKNGEDEKAANIYSDGLKNEYSATLLENLVIVQTRLRKFEDALANLSKLDSNPEREFTKGTLLLSLKKYGEAINILEDLAQKKIANDLKEKTYIRLSEAYLLERKYAKTIETADKYEAINKSYNKEIVNFKAIAYFRLGQYTKARELYERNLNNPEEKASSFYMIAETYYNERNYLEAKNNYTKAVESSSDIKLKKDSEYWLIRIEDVLGNQKALFERADNFRKNYPNSEYDEDITYLVAKIHEESQDRKKAIDEYAKLYNITGNKLTKDEMAKRITELYYEEKDIKNMNLWIGRVSEEAYKILWQAYAYELEKKDVEAIKNYEKIVKDQNYGDSANYKLGLYYLNKEDYKKARGYFEAVMSFDISVNKERAQYNIGLTYEKEKEYLNAISSFLKIKLLMDDSELDDLILLKLGENYEKLENSEKSFEYYKEYHNKYKNKKDYSYAVEKLLINRLNENKINEAKVYFEELQRINPDRAKIYTDYMK